jgi:sporulenol synthase
MEGEQCMLESVQRAIEHIVRSVEMAQGVDGSFRYCYESGLMTDAYMIILLRTLAVHDEELIHMLAQRITNMQDASGSWKLFHDEEQGNLSATIDAYYALIASGFVKKTNEPMQTAKQFILDHGGMQNSRMLTQVILSITGQMTWPAYFQFPIEFIVLPDFLPINFYEFVGFARVHLLPVIIANTRKFTIQSKLLPDLTDLQYGTRTNVRMGSNARSLSTLMQEAIKGFQAIPKMIGNLQKELRERALEQAKHFILERIETNGTFYGYASPTYLMVFAFLALGYTREHSIIKHAIDGLKSLFFHEGNLIHLQNTTSTVWDTALLSYALQEAGISERVPLLQRANTYILSRQHKKGGDWQVHNPNVAPGGWGFSDINTFNPDVDDTGAALRALQKLASYQPSVSQSWKKGYDWVRSMQNDDGGWPAFEKNTDNPLLSAIKIDGTASILTDPSSVDLSGRMLEFLGTNGHSGNESFIKKAVDWVLRQQEANGSWFGRWGICYIYGTWAALTGLMAVGTKAEHPAIRKAVDWLLHIQNADGGWGESCKSDQVKKYIALGHSTPSQTAWAVDALISVFDQPIPAIKDGIGCILHLQSQPHSDWRLQYPTGAGLPGSFYTHYHSYRYIWPLLALAHYRKKYLQ